MTNNLLTLFLLQSFVLLSEILIWLNQYQQVALVASLGIERFEDSLSADDVVTLRRQLDLVSKHYRLHFSQLREYVTEHFPTDSEIPGKDLFEFLEKLPDVDGSLYLMLPEDLAKQNPNYVVKSNGESKKISL